MNEQEIKNIINKQHIFFDSGATLDVSYRIQSLKRLSNSIKVHESEIAKAIKEDLGKSENEAYMCEIALCLTEISYMLKHIRTFSRSQKAPSSLVQFPAKCYLKPSPYGTVLIMSPWNYPFLLTMTPLIDALAAGNTAVLKPSSYSPHTSRIIKKIIEECFPDKYVSVILGNRTQNKLLLNEKFDYIFFTGSQTIGKLIMRTAAETLTPVTLELGGKSPCIVDKSANIKLSARRIVFGKFLNCGQTCVAPDYIFCHNSIKDELIEHIKKEIELQFGQNPLANDDYGKIINQKHFDRIIGLMDKNKIVHGGRSDTVALRIEPTVLDNITFDDAIMQEEIFGPLMPIITFDTIDEAMIQIKKMPHPLALYIFTTDMKTAENFTSRCGFGGGCINDTIIHLSNSHLPFGGFGESGMGSYHGKTGFNTFSHYKSIVNQKNWLDLPMRYQPYTEFYSKLIRLFLR